MFLTDLEKIGTFEDVEPEEGVLLVTIERERDTEVLFVDNFPNPKRFMEELSRIVQTFNSFLNKSPGKGEDFIGNEVGKFLKAFLKSGIDFKLLALFKEMIDYPDEGFRIPEYGFYSSRGFASEDEFKTLVENGRAKWNRTINFRSVKSGQKEDEELTLKISVSGTRIWRKIQVRLSTTFEELHEMIQIVMGWGNDHLHAFYSNQDVIEPESFEIGIFLIQKGDRISYVYDFGDEWRIDIKCEKTAKLDPKKHYPICIGGKKRGPVEDSGGVWEYQNIVDSYFDPSDKYNKEAHEWLGEGFDPDRFDLEKINEDLKKFFHR